MDALAAGAISALLLVPAQGASAHHRPLPAWCGGDVRSGVFPVYCESISKCGRTPGAVLLWHRYQQTPGGAWSTWMSLGGMSGGMPGPPGVERYADGRIQVFIRGDDASLYTNWSCPRTGPGTAGSLSRACSSASRTSTASPAAG